MVANSDIASLKKLRKDLNNIESINKKIKDTEPQINRYREACYKKYPKPIKLDTNHAEKYKSTVLADKAKKSKILSGVLFAITFIALIAYFIFFLFKFDYLGNTYLYVPEIVKEYKGQYVKDYSFSSDFVRDDILTITSCSESGKVTGTFEYYEDGEILGKYEFQGKILGKSSNEEYLEMSMYKTQWIEQPNYDPGSGYYSPLDEEIVKICDNYTTIQTSTHQLYSADSPGETLVKDLETPEILRSYAGTYDTVLSENYGVITLTSCDKKGRVTGFFEFQDGDIYGKYALKGKITEKYANGRILLTLSAGEWIEHPEYYEPLDDMNIEICDQYITLLCSQYEMDWKDTSADDSEELFKRKPLTEEELANRNFMAMFFLIIPVLGFLLSFILKKSLGLKSLNQKEMEELKAFEDKDRANQQVNNSYNQRVEEREHLIFEDVYAYTKTLQTDLNDTLKKLEDEVQKNHVLGPKEKNLSAVEYIIDLIESRRADSVKEALLIMDEDKRRKEEEKRRRKEQKRREKEEFQRKLIELENKSRWEEFDRKLQARQEAEDYLNQMFERQKMKKAIDDQTYELKRIRKELEDRR